MTDVHEHYKNVDSRPPCLTISSSCFSTHIHSLTPSLQLSLLIRVLSSSFPYLPRTFVSPAFVSLSFYVARANPSSSSRHSTAPSVSPSVLKRLERPTLSNPFPRLIPHSSKISKWEVHSMPKLSSSLVSLRRISLVSSLPLHIERFPYISIYLNLILIRIHLSHLSYICGGLVGLDHLSSQGVPPVCFSFCFCCDALTAYARLRLLHRRMYKAPFSLIKVLYYFNRYYTLAEMILVLYVRRNSLSNLLLGRTNSYR